VSRSFGGSPTAERLGGPFAPKAKEERKKEKEYKFPYIFDPRPQLEQFIEADQESTGFEYVSDTVFAFKVFVAILP
jgi:hypothetical protein